MSATHTPTTAPTSGPTVSPGPAGKPAQVLDLRGWKLTLPVPAGGSTTAAEIAQPQLSQFVDAPWFDVDASGTAVLFRANAGGATTSGSSYPRSELREMSPDGSTKASWSTTSGSHTMTLREAVTHLTVAKPQLVVAQVHDASNDVIEVLADGNRANPDGTYGICVRVNGVEQSQCLNPSYAMGTFFDLQIVAGGGRITVRYNGVTKLDVAVTDTGCYFKAGAYTQSNPSTGDDPAAYGETAISRLSVLHTA